MLSSCHFSSEYLAEQGQMEIRILDLFTSISSNFGGMLRIIVLLEDPVVTKFYISS